MRSIAKTFVDLASRNQGGLIAYVTAGDPQPSCTPRIVEAIAGGGSDIIELGIPFSDPIADGPTIQAASVRALKAGTTPRKVLQICERIRERIEVPIVILTYYNPIFRMGLGDFFESACASGIDGVIVPDLPIEEAGEYKRFAGANEIDTIFLAAPSTSAARLEEIVEYTSGFLYLVSVLGVTGAREKLQDFTIDLIRKALPVIDGKSPLAVGFGVSRPAHVSAITRNGADAAIVGSGFVRIIEKSHSDEERMLEDVREYASQLKAATVRLV